MTVAPACLRQIDGGGQHASVNLTAGVSMLANLLNMFRYLDRLVHTLNMFRCLNRLVNTLNMF